MNPLTIKDLAKYLSFSDLFELGRSDGEGHGGYDELHVFKV